MDWNKFKTMSTFQKTQWIIQYYGLTIVVVLVTLLVGAIFMKSVFGAENEYAIRIMILDDHLSKEVVNRFRDDLRIELEGECDISSYMENDISQKQAFTVRLLADELDIVIAPKKEIEEMQQSGYLRRIEAISQDSFYYSVTRGEDDKLDTDLYVGETVKSKNSSSIDAVISYIQRKR